MTKKQTFNSLVPNSFDYHQGKLWEGLDYPLFRMNLDVISKLIAETKAEADRRFGSYTSRQGLQGELDSIDFILERLTHWNVTRADIDKRDLYVYLEALGSHFKQLFEMYDEMDAE